MPPARHPPPSECKGRSTGAAGDDAMGRGWFILNPSNRCLIGPPARIIAVFQVALCLVIAFPGRCPGLRNNGPLGLDFSQGIGRGFWPCCCWDTVGGRFDFRGERQRRGHSSTRPNGPGMLPPEPICAPTGRHASVPYITFVELHLVPFQQSPVFILETHFLMVLRLVDDISGHRIGVGLADGKRAVA